MLLFSTERGEALRRFLVDDGVGKDSRQVQVVASIHNPRLELHDLMTGSAEVDLGPRNLMTHLMQYWRRWSPFA